MSLAEYSAYPDVDKLMAEVGTYDLYEHIVELEAYGLTRHGASHRDFT